MVHKIFSVFFLFCTQCKDTNEVFVDMKAFLYKYGTYVAKWYLFHCFYTSGYSKDVSVIIKLRLKPKDIKDETIDLFKNHMCIF